MKVEEPIRIRFELPSDAKAISNLVEAIGVELWGHIAFSPANPECGASACMAWALYMRFGFQLAPASAPETEPAEYFKALACVGEMPNASIRCQEAFEAANRPISGRSDARSEHASPQNSYSGRLGERVVSTTKPDLIF